MVAYHKVVSDKVEAVLTKGLRKATRSETDDNPWIVRTDVFLDERCPKSLRSQGVRRRKAVYAYMSVQNSVIDITDGSLIPIEKFVTAGKEAVIELELEPERCFVSDLDTYDALKSALQENHDQKLCETLAVSYWRKLTRLSDFSLETMRRPEIMVTYDIPPSELRVVYFGFWSRFGDSLKRG